MKAARIHEFGAEDVIRYEDAAGVIQTIRLTDSTPRGQHLLPAPAALGGWVELVKSTGSTWFPDSPTVRVEILNFNSSKTGLSLGLQGFLDSSTKPNDDSLSVWFEVLGTPDTILTGTQFDISTRIVASPPEPVINFGSASSVSALFVGGAGRLPSVNDDGRVVR